MTTVTAAVARESGIALETLELEEPRAGEALVRFRTAGLCHTDLDVAAGNLPTPRPVVPGHEGVGVVEALGEGVTGVAVGDRVLMSIDSCGLCRACTGGHVQYCDAHFPLNFLAQRGDGSTGLRDAAGHPVHDHFFGQSAFATHGLVAQRSLIRVEADIDDASLAPLACGAITGAGAVTAVLGVRPGSTVAVLGAGTVGLSAVMAAVAAGARQVVVLDAIPDRLVLARELGATDTVGAVDDPTAALLELTGGVGFDYAVESSGAPALMRVATDVIANLGEAVLLGFASMTERIGVSAFDLLRGKSVRGAVMGHLSPSVLVGHLLAEHAAGRFPIERLVTRYPLSAIEQAIADVHDGRSVKAVLEMPAP